MHDKCNFNLYTSTIFIKCIHISEPKTTIKKQFLALLRFWVSLKIYSLQKYRFEWPQYFKVEAMKFPTNHPQRSYVKKTTEATGLSQRTISWICQNPKSSTACSLAAARNSRQWEHHQNSKPPPLQLEFQLRTRHHHLRLGKYIPGPLSWMTSTSVWFDENRRILHGQEAVTHHWQAVCSSITWTSPYS